MSIHRAFISELFEKQCQSWKKEPAEVAEKPRMMYVPKTNLDKSGKLQQGQHLKNVHNETEHNPDSRDDVRTENVRKNPEVVPNVLNLDNNGQAYVSKGKEVLVLKPAF